jgi:L-seryl-tRNA(Ser) seleniumtransferase
VPPARLRDIPKVDRLLAELAGESTPHAAVLAEVRALLDELRAQLRAASAGAPDLGPSLDLSLQGLAAEVRQRLAVRARRGAVRVINATGVLLHTGLGRATLAPEAVAALARAGHPQRVELDLETGERGGRDTGVEALLCELTGAEAATVVNNNAGATLLILAALARGKGVVVSRGELVEIGGSYRIPDILEESGARLVEVGTTNRTHVADYRRALAPEVGLLLKVHTSNYRLVGFTAEVTLAELVALGREHGLPVVHDLGSGCLVDLAARGLPGEAWVRASVATDADLVCFSGDKLLGGPQAGLIVGSAAAVARCRAHPLYRALRPGRLTYAALEATLELYRLGEEAACAQVPVLRQLSTPLAELERRARRIARRWAGLPGCQARAVPLNSQAGSGSLPAHELPSWGVELEAQALSAQALAKALRQGEPPIVTRVQQDQVRFDVRSFDDREAREIEARLGELAAGL